MPAGGITSRASILLADDDASICTVLEQAIAQQGYDVRVTREGKALWGWVEQGAGDLVITDVMMPDADGLELLKKIKSIRPTLPVIVISARRTLLTAVKAAEFGAFEFLAKPFDLDELMKLIRHSLEAAEGSAPQREASAEAMPFIGDSPAMQELYRGVARLTSVDLTVLIEGESGTGKELIARALHEYSPRKQKAFVAVNMAAIPRELIESELFGHERGAFTGATGRKAGKFEQAEGGTLFLDEIGDMPVEAQTRLLRVLQQGEYSAVGGQDVRKTDVRILCATNRDLKAMVAAGTFREDLFYRLNVVPLHVPPLRERREDIPALAEHFLMRAEQKGLSRKTLAPDAVRLLMAHSWPGNVRELENLIYRLAALTAERQIPAYAVSAELPGVGPSAAADASSAHSLAGLMAAHLRRYFAALDGDEPAAGLYQTVIEEVEKPLIEQVLDYTGGNQIRAAEVLGINRNTLRKKIQELGIAVLKQ